MARPPKLTKRRKAELIEALEDFPMLSMCARKVGVHPSTVRRAMQQDDAFARAVREARRFALDRVWFRLHQQAFNDASFEQRLRYLQSVHPAFAGNKVEVTVKGKGKRMEL